MELTIKEAIQLILDFRHFPAGFWKDIPIEDPLVNQFIECGYATLDPERQEKYELNNEGADLLHTYIASISTTFITFIKERQFSCFDSDAVNWFQSTYGLNNDTAESLYDYITFNLENYGYKRFRFYQSTPGWGYLFEAV